LQFRPILLNCTDIVWQHYERAPSIHNRWKTRCCRCRILPFYVTTTRNEILLLNFIIVIPSHFSKVIPTLIINWKQIHVCIDILFSDIQHAIVTRKWVKTTEKIKTNRPIATATVEFFFFKRRSSLWVCKDLGLTVLKIIFGTTVLISISVWNG